MKVSVIIPVYRSSPYVERVASILSRQTAPVEIIVVVDEPEEWFLEKLHSIEGVKLIVNRTRIGKAKALNMAVNHASGDLLLFLDSDVEIPDDDSFIEKLMEEFGDADIIDLRKEVVDNGLLPRMAYYEYLASNAASWLLTRVINGLPAINGSAFAVKREVFDSVGGFASVISEDFEFATRAYLKGYKFSYSKRLTVYSHVHKSWGDWLRQRERWALGAVDWAARWAFKILRTFAQKPQVLLAALVMLLPSIVTGISGLLMATFATVNMPTSSANMIADLSLMGGIAMTITGFAAIAALYWAFGRALGYNVRLVELALYYFIYSPLYPVSYTHLTLPTTERV